MKVLSIINSKEGISNSSREIISYSHKLNAETFVFCEGTLSTEQVDILGNYGANKIFAYKNEMDDSQLIKEISNLASKNDIDYIIFSNNFHSKSIAPRVAIKMECAIISSVVEVLENNTFKCVEFSGKAFAIRKSNTKTTVITLTPNSHKAYLIENKSEIEEIDNELTEIKVKVLERIKTKDKISLMDADKVVSAGRGMKGPENWGMIEELASVIGAATACSRPVSDEGWRPHGEHVGQTGLAIRPNLYIAIGISGAIQHLAGVNGSKTIVVINKDIDAPFFKAADYGIVGDAFEVIPKLINILKN